MARTHTIAILASLSCAIAFAPFALAAEEPATSETRADAEQSDVKRPEPLTPENWPKTVSAAVTHILSGLSDKDRNFLRDTQKKDLIRYHHGWGTGIRNHYGLWRGNTELIHNACGKECHPDDASMIIIEAVWEENRAQRDGA